MCILRKKVYYLFSVYSVVTLISSSMPDGMYSLAKEARGGGMNNGYLKTGFVMTDSKLHTYIKQANIF